MLIIHPTGEKFIELTFFRRVLLSNEYVFWCFNSYSACDLRKLYLFMYEGLFGSLHCSYLHWWIRKEWFLKRKFALFSHANPSAKKFQKSVVAGMDFIVLKSIPFLDSSQFIIKEYSKCSSDSLSFLCSALKPSVPKPLNT